jgi:hypothetical protein
MRDFLESLAAIFVVLGGIVGAIGLSMILLSFSSSGISSTIGIDLAVSGVLVMLMAGAVYLLAVIAESLQKQRTSKPNPSGVGSY